MVLLSGMKHMHYTFDPIFKLQKKDVRATSLQPHMFPSLPTFNNLKLLTMYEIFAFRFLIFVLESVNKFHLAAFMTFSYSVHLLINMPQDRPAKVIYIYSAKTVYRMVYSQFAILVLNFETCGTQKCSIKTFHQITTETSFFEQGR